MLPRHKRFIGILITLVGVTAAIYLILTSFQDNLLYYLTPSEAVTKNMDDQSTFRIGGLVEMGSFKRADGSLKASFVLTDGIESIEVNYTGILPDLFREGQGIIVTGRFNKTKVFIASEVLAKHDENYMPPDIHALEEPTL
ncbi:MAG: cytochrome c maturation protein CcmE [Gammaproteobacteria bacterium]|jgi:cytochrome c-type biogenesis protein CcmE|nr:cytochrome c maturation protein CcmE [Gammaproteobacteria bacterium]MBQ08370.1 cytochrome c maturation protein CcmE [Gammaproteobacteria bacterium]MDP6146680.1 cytochrome c maturation protein CcmE [Gammaproteobacteria bacterium]HJL79617.1 cytochrome c maturation protein CcmE [Gammaproteobacteria bacterium]HJM09124.1 cytochrome c maturation protein CcmE [Gammaproteobacteria bacterium]